MKKSLLLIAVLLFAALPLFVVQPSYAGTPAGTITYSAGTDTITVVGANSSHPAEFLDLYNADVAGGWGQVTKDVSGFQFSIACKVVIGNGTSAGATYFTDTKKEVYFASVLAGNGEYIIHVTGYSVLTLGNLYDESRKETRYGCSVFANEGTYYGDLVHNDGSSYLYGCFFEGVGAQSCRLNGDGGQIRIWGCLYQGTIYPRANCAVALCSAEMPAYGLELPPANFTLSDLTILRASYLTHVRDVSNVTFRDVVVTSVVTKLAQLSNAGCGTVNFVNVESPIWTFTFSSAANAVVNRQYTWNIYVLNGALTDFVEDANVTLTHDGVVYGSWLSNSTGQIATQTLTYGFYNQTGGDTMYGGTAWTLTITHPDWETYTSQFYPYAKMDWSISMQDTTTANNNILLSGLFVGVLCFAGFIVYIKRGN